MTFRYPSLYYLNLSQKLIQIIGFASIEGRIRHNEMLGEQRAIALKRYIQNAVEYVEPTPRSMKEVEEMQIKEALQRNHFNRSKTAKELGISVVG